MRLWSRLLTMGLVLTMALGLAVSPAQAARKKKKETRRETKREVRREVRHETYHAKSYISGTNLWGRAGLLYADTSEVAPIGKVEGSAFFTYQSLASASYGGYSTSDDLFTIPFGLHFGAAKDVDLYASGDVMINSISSNIPGFTGASSTNFAINFGGKYRIAAHNRQTPDFSVGGDITIPTNGGNVIATPKGTITYVLDSGLLLNGEMGIAISSTTYVMADAGVGFPVSRKITLIGELGANQGGYTDSVLAAGGRFDLGGGTKAQALVGIPFNGGGVALGAGIILASE